MTYRDLIYKAWLLVGVSPEDAKQSLQRSDMMFPNKAVNQEIPEGREQAYLDDLVIFFQKTLAADRKKPFINAHLKKEEERLRSTN